MRENGEESIIKKLMCGVRRWACAGIRMRLLLRHAGLLGMVENVATLHACSPAASYTHLIPSHPHAEAKLPVALDGTLACMHAWDHAKVEEGWASLVHTACKLCRSSLW